METEDIHTSTVMKRVKTLDGRMVFTEGGVYGIQNKHGQLLPYLPKLPKGNINEKKMIILPKKREERLKCYPNPKLIPNLHKTEQFTFQEAETNTTNGTGREIFTEEAAREERGVYIRRIVKKELGYKHCEAVNFEHIRNLAVNYKPPNIEITVCFHDSNVFGSRTRLLRVTQDTETLPNYGLFKSKQPLTNPFKGSRKNVIGYRSDDAMLPRMGSKWHKPIKPTQIEDVEIGVKATAVKPRVGDALKRKHDAMNKSYEGRVQAQQRAEKLLKEDREITGKKYPLMIHYSYTKPVPKPAVKLHCAHKELQQTDCQCQKLPRQPVVYYPPTNDLRRRKPIDYLDDELDNISDASTPPASPKR